jgi:hypothetical protein
MMPSATLTVVSTSTIWERLERAQFEAGYDVTAVNFSQVSCRRRKLMTVMGIAAHSLPLIAFVAKFRVKVSGLERSSRAGFVPETALLEPQLPQCSFGDLRRTSVIGFKS